MKGRNGRDLGNILQCPEPLGCPNGFLDQNRSMREIGPDVSGEDLKGLRMRFNSQDLTSRVLSQKFEGIKALTRAQVHDVLCVGPIKSRGCHVRAVFEDLCENLDGRICAPSSEPYGESHESNRKKFISFGKDALLKHTPVVFLNLSDLFVVFDRFGVCQKPGEIFKVPPHLHGIPDLRLVVQDLLGKGEIARVGNDAFSGACFAFPDEHGPEDHLDRPDSDKEAVQFPNRHLDLFDIRGQ